jgi:hypothetical protein
MAVREQDNKFIQVIVPASVNGAATVIDLDTKGWAYCSILVTIGSITGQFSVLKVAEADDDSNFSDVPGTRFGTDNTVAGSLSVLPQTANRQELIEIDLRDRKKWLRLVCTTGGVTVLAAEAILSRPTNFPSSTAGRGVENIMRSS